MRALEIALLALNIPLLIPLLFKRGAARPLWQPKVRLLLSVTAVLVGVMHVLLEGGRWQLALAYGLTGANLFASLWQAQQPGRAGGPGRSANTPTWIRRAAGLFGLFALGLSAALAYLFPIPKLPALTGPFRVGTAVLHFVDPTRPELYNPTPGGPRELMVQIWYPAEPETGAPPGPWMAEADIATPAIARRLNLPAFLFSHLRLARTHAVFDAPAAPGSGPYPVLLFSHGWGGLRTQNIAQVEELASHGYVVAAVDHTYGAVVTVFPDGRTALWNQAILPFGAAQSEFDKAANQLVETWAGDLGFVLDQLAAGPFRERLDLKRVGVFGHSTGGGATVVFCTRDPRCQAGQAMDAWLEPVPQAVIAAGLDQPFLFMRSEAWEQPGRNPRNDQLQAEVLTKLRGAGYRMTIAGTAHFDFSSLPLFSPLTTALGLKGPIDGARVNEIVNAYTLAFFDQQLKKLPEPLLDGPAAAYPEVTILAEP